MSPPRRFTHTEGWKSAGNRPAARPAQARSTTLGGNTYTERDNLDGFSLHTDPITPTMQVEVRWWHRRLMMGGGDEWCGNRARTRLDASGA